MSIDAITARSVALTLSGCTDTRVVPVRHIIKYHTDNGNELSVATANSQLNVIDLRPGKQYRFQIQCENSAGMIGPSVTKYATTLPEGLFHAESISYHTVHVTIYRCITAQYM